MENPQKLLTLGTQDTERKHTKQKTHHSVQTNINNAKRPGLLH